MSLVQHSLLLFLIPWIVNLDAVFAVGDGADADRPNVLFVMFEDLRPELPSYGSDLVIAPTLEGLAKKGLVFDLAMAAVGVCAPSRTSMLTGLRPDTLGIYDFQHYGGTRFFRSMSSHFHRSGYQTGMSGKFQHWDSYRFYSGNYFGSPDWETAQKKEMKWHNASVTPDAVNEREKEGKEGHFFRDSLVADNAIKFLEEVESDQPWFLAVGFKGTHMQYQMPKRFWDMYDGLDEKLDALLDDIFPPLRGHHATESVTDPDPDPGAGSGVGEEEAGGYLQFPLDNPVVSRVRKAESRGVQFMRANATLPAAESESYLMNRDGSDRMSMSRRAWKELYRGYLACLTYADHQFGRLLSHLPSSSFSPEGQSHGDKGKRDTIVVFTADHGMHIGEKGLWCKWSLFEEAARVPLIIHDPRHPSSHGKHFTRPVELLDLFPTLVDLTDTPLEEQRGERCREDVNFGGQMRRRASLQREAEEAERRLREVEAGQLEALSDLRNSSYASASASAYASAEADKEGGPRKAEIIASLDRIRKQMPDELGDLPGIEEALRLEGRMHRSGEDDTLFRHVYCDSLQGLSLGRLVRGGTDHPERRPFAITQRMTCKAPGHLQRHPDDVENNVTTGGWIDHCPNKKLPRVPSVGAMGYSLRYVDYRYTAWLAFDVNTYLPVLDGPPLAEELYHHPPADNLHLPRVFKAELHNLAPQAAQALLLTDSPAPRSSSSGGGPQIGYSSYTGSHDNGDARAHARKLAASRRDLYDFLYHNTSFAHLFHSRLGEQSLLLRELKSGKRVGSNRRKTLQKELLGITHKRVPGSPHPHWELYGRHYFATGDD